MENQPNMDKTFPRWISAIEDLKPEQVEIILGISLKYQIPPGDFIEQAIQEKIQRDFPPTAKGSAR